MKKLLVAGAALALVVFTSPAFVGQAQAAPPKSPFCSIGYQASNESWADFYHCWGWPPAPVGYHWWWHHRHHYWWRHHHHHWWWRHHVLAAPPKSPFCNIGYQASNESWADFYHCWGWPPVPAGYRWWRWHHHHWW